MIIHKLPDPTARMYIAKYLRDQERARLGPWCHAHLSRASMRVIPLRSRHTRLERLKAHRLEPDQCGVAADYAVDGYPMCKRHAAEAALEEMTK